MLRLGNLLLLIIYNELKNILNKTVVAWFVELRWCGHGRADDRARDVVGKNRLRRPRRGGIRSVFAYTHVGESNLFYFRKFTRSPEDSTSRQHDVLIIDVAILTRQEPNALSRSRTHARTKSTSNGAGEFVDDRAAGLRAATRPAVRQRAAIGRDPVPWPRWPTGITSAPFRARATRSTWTTLVGFDRFVSGRSPERRAFCCTSVSDFCAAQGVQRAESCSFVGRSNCMCVRSATSVDR